MYSVYAEARDKMKLSDGDVARLSGVASATISNWKHGKYTPKIDKLVRIANVVGLKPEELYTR